MSLSSLVSAVSSAVGAATPTPPSSQKPGDKPIMFYLRDQSVSPDVQTTLTLGIRPEELTRVDVSRTTVQQTLGGAFIDSFGQGLSTINISGTTGWRGDKTGDGAAQFTALRNKVYLEWHSRRNAAAKAGKNPQLVSLVFIDALDGNLDLVIPMNFTLRRSRSRPLLMQYNIQMVSIKWVAKQKSSSSSSANPLQSLLKSIKNILSAVQGVINVVRSIASQVTAFMNTATSIFNQVSSLISQAQAIPQDIMGTARAMALAGSNMFATIASVGGNSTSQMATAMGIGAEFQNILCLLNNAVNQQQIYQDYTPLYGASNCSSTNGGSPESPYADTNPFYSVVGAPQNAPPPLALTSTSPVIQVSSVSIPKVSVTPLAQQSLVQINSTDIVLAPLSITTLGKAAGNIAAGVTLV